MKTRNEVMEMLERDLLATTAIRTADANGANESYGSTLVEDLLEQDAAWDRIDDYDDYLGCDLVKEGDIDLDIWAQDLPANCIDGLRQAMIDGALYVARFWSPDLGALDILVWD